TAVYVDGFGGRVARPNARRLLAEAAQHTVDVIIIERLDHLAPSVRELAAVFNDLHRCRVSLVSLHDEIDTAAAERELVVRVMRAVGRFEHRLHGHRIRVGLARAKAAGTRVGRPPAAVDTAAVVGLRSQGRSYRQIGRQLGISASLAYRLSRASGEAPEAVYKPRGDVL